VVNYGRFGHLPATSEAPATGTRERLARGYITVMLGGCGQSRFRA
jgi:hypothetical protein